MASSILTAYVYGEWQEGGKIAYASLCYYVRVKGNCRQKSVLRHHCNLFCKGWGSGK